mmetsp:Transcript_49393/g.142030  ORF Transcript_49393/g.142030 Transcript_49393/m.142030 type:complete len:265 (+) Transcript_49393:596-1390(+)
MGPEWHLDQDVLHRRARRCSLNRKQGHVPLFLLAQPAVVSHALGRSRGLSCRGGPLHVHVTTGPRICRHCVRRHRNQQARTGFAGLLVGGHARCVCGLLHEAREQLWAVLGRLPTWPGRAGSEVSRGRQGASAGYRAHTSYARLLRRQGRNPRRWAGLANERDVWHRQDASVGDGLGDLACTTPQHFSANLGRCSAFGGHSKQPCVLARREASLHNRSRCYQGGDLVNSRVLHHTDRRAAPQGVVQAAPRPRGGCQTVCGAREL